MATTTNAHSAAPTSRATTLHDRAARLYALLACGHESLAFNVDARGPALTTVEGGKRRVVQLPGADGEGRAPPWRRAKELRAGEEIDRRFNAWVLAKHLAGAYSVAPGAPSWCAWAALDIDAHPRPRESRAAARGRADQVLANVWRALACSAARQPLVFRSPGGGYHVWLPLTRGPASQNPEHTWPAWFVRQCLVQHLDAAGVALGDGVLELFPSGRFLRAPCGARMVLLEPARPDCPDDLGLAPWRGTIEDEERVDWFGARDELSSPVRRVGAMVDTCCDAWEAQRRTLADWLGRPELEWDRTWGPLVWREDDAPPAFDVPVDAATARELGREKNTIASIEDESDPSQESDEVPAGGAARSIRIGRAPRPVGRTLRRGRDQSRNGSRARSPSASSEENSPTPSAPELADAPALAGDRLVRGRAYFEKVARLLEKGITEPSSRHDAVLTLAFYWGAVSGLDDAAVLSRLEDWCRKHLHEGSRLAGKVSELVAQSHYEARHYLRHHGPGWFRGGGAASGAVSLSAADRVVVDAVDERVRGEVASIAVWLAGRAGLDGRVSEPLQIATGLLDRLCGDRRIVVAGERRRATTMAIEQLERIGVLTLARGYVVGRRGREFSVWYRFGSGELPRAAEIPATTWVAAAPKFERASSRGGDVGDGAPAPSRQAERHSLLVAVRVLGERTVAEGTLQVLSDGTRGAPRAVVIAGHDVGAPTSSPRAAAWWERMYQWRAFTVAELYAADASKLVPFPDVEARKRMTRRQRLAIAAEPGTVVVLPASSNTAAAERDAFASELANEVNEAVARELAAELPEVALAWRRFLRTKDS